MAAVEPVTVEEAAMAMALRNHLAKKAMEEDGMSLEDAALTADIRMYVMALRAALTETGSGLADEAEAFLRER